MDNHTFKRLTYQVLDHSPSHVDIINFFKSFCSILRRKNLKLVGITTDASPLYPEPIARIFGENIQHQICEFHVIKEINKGVLRAVASVRKSIKIQQPQTKRGRPRGSTWKRAVRQKKRLKQKIADLFEHRYLFVQHVLSVSEQKIFNRITRGFPELRSLRLIMDEVYRLFDRRCRTDTALEKLAKLRKKIRRFKKLAKTLTKIQSPNIEKALIFLDNKMLPSTSNAVERGNRRHRKMQKTVYRVRTHQNIHQRIALDMMRDSRKVERNVTITTLHKVRTG